MPGGAVDFAVPTDVSRIEAPVTVKAYLLCAFAAFGGIFLCVSRYHSLARLTLRQRL